MRAHLVPITHRGMCMSWILWDAVTACRLGSRILAPQPPPPSAALEQLLQCKRSSDSAQANSCTVLDVRPTHIRETMLRGTASRQGFSKPGRQTHGIEDTQQAPSHRLGLVHLVEHDGIQPVSVVHHDPVLRQACPDLRWWHIGMGIYIRKDCLMPTEHTSVQIQRAGPVDTG